MGPQFSGVVKVNPWDIMAGVDGVLNPAWFCARQVPIKPSENKINQRLIKTFYLLNAKRPDNYYFDLPDPEELLIEQSNEMKEEVVESPTVKQEYSPQKANVPPQSPMHSNPATPTQNVNNNNSPGVHQTPPGQIKQQMSGQGHY